MDQQQVIKSKNQKEIVEMDEKLFEPGNEYDEKVFLPGIESLYKITDHNQVTEVKKKYSSLEKCSTKTRKEIASNLADVILSFQNMIGFEWTIGKSEVFIKTTDGFVEMLFDPNDLPDMLYNMLRSRALVNKINWEFGKPYVEITYTEL